MELGQSSRNRLLRLFAGIAFGYSALVVVILQKIVLPHWVPHLMAIDGLLAGTDSVDFHDQATLMAQRMHEQGWSAWVLRPALGGTPIGLTAVLYRYISPHPWVLIPFNAALHAGAALWIVFIVESIAGTLPSALIAGGLYLIFPSALGWYGQIHRDGYHILGYLLVVSCWIRLSKDTIWKSTDWRWLFWCIGEAVLGTLLIWLARPYARTFLCLLSLPVAVLLLLRGVRSFRVYGAKKVAPAALMICLVLILLGKASPTFDNYDHELSETEAKSLGMDPELNADKWDPSSYLPSSIDFRLKQLALARNAAKRKYKVESSFIDMSVRFENAWQLIRYIPRALQIGFLAPFPDRWFVRGSTPAGTLFRAISALEMLTTYLAFLYVAWNLRVLFRKRAFQVLAWFSSCMILVNALVVNNVGSLYRLRYGYLMPFAALGVALAFLHWEDVVQQLKFELGSSSRDVTSA